jgi:hypothetical protein
MEIPKHIEPFPLFETAQNEQSQVNKGDHSTPVTEHFLLFYASVFLID